MLIPTSRSQRFGSGSFVALLGQDSDVQQPSVDKAIVEFNGTDLELYRDPSGWLRAQIGLDTAFQNMDNDMLDSQLLRAQPFLDSPVKFAKVAANSHSGSWFLMTDVWLKRRARQSTFEPLYQELKHGLVEGLRVTEDLSATGEAASPQRDSSREAVTEEDIIGLDKVAEEIESHLKETGWDWSRGDSPASFRVNLDLDEYFQRIDINPEGVGRIRFRSPIVGLENLSECCEAAISDYLLRANAALRLARASVVSDPRQVSVIEEAGVGSSHATVVLEVMLPYRLWTAFTLEQILGSLIVGARATRLETEVLFDPGAAQLYLDILEKEKQEYVNRKSRHQQAAG